MTTCAMAPMSITVDPDVTKLLRRTTESMTRHGLARPASHVMRMLGDGRLIDVRPDGTALRVTLKPFAELAMRHVIDLCDRDMVSDQKERRAFEVFRIAGLTVGSCG